MVRLVSQRQPQHLTGLSFVVLLHLLLGYAFLNGLAAHRSADVPAPLEVRLMEQQKKPVVKQVSIELTPKLERAPDTHIDPPPIKSEQPPLDPPRDLHGITDKPSIQPPPVGLAGAAGQNAGTGIPQGRSSAQNDCSNASSLASSIAYPARAKRLGIQQGQVNVEFSVAAGGALQIDTLTASNPVFEAAARDAVMALHCSTGRYRLPISFVLQE